MTAKAKSDRVDHDCIQVDKIQDLEVLSRATMQEIGQIKDALLPSEFHPDNGLITTVAKLKKDFTVLQVEINKIFNTINKNHTVEMNSINQLLEFREENKERVEALEVRVETRIKDTDKELTMIKEKGREIIQYQKLTRWIVNNPWKAVGIALFLFSTLLTLASVLELKTILDFMK